METDDEWVAEETFTEFLARMPQVCVEVLLETDDGVLVAKRENKPRVWFWPGSRLYKGEALEAAVHRVAREELGIEITLHEQLGVNSHFWDADETDTGESRHTVNIVYRATPAANDFEITLDDQHSAYRFLDEPESELHPYVREYLDTYELVSPVQ